MGQYATEVIGRCAFGLDFNTISNPNSDFRRTGRDAFTPSPITNFIRFIGFGCVLDLFRIRGMPDHVYDYFDKILKTTITLHEQEKNTRHDFISLMVKIKDEENLKEHEQSKYLSNIKKHNVH